MTTSGRSFRKCGPVFVLALAASTAGAAGGEATKSAPEEILSDQLIASGNQAVGTYSCFWRQGRGSEESYEVVCNYSFDGRANGKGEFELFGQNGFGATLKRNGSVASLSSIEGQCEGAEELNCDVVELDLEPSKAHVRTCQANQEKVFFHRFKRGKKSTSPTKTAAYLVRGDQVTVTGLQDGDFIGAVYHGKAKSVVGWLKQSEIKCNL